MTEEHIMETRIKYIQIMNTVCESCYVKEKELQILLLKETPYGLVGNLVCAECSIKFKVGDIIK